MSTTHRQADSLVQDVGQKENFSTPGKTAQTDIRYVTTVANRDISDRFVEPQNNYKLKGVTDKKLNIDRRTDELAKRIQLLHWDSKV